MSENKIVSALVAVVIIGIVSIGWSCSENYRVKKWGGKAEIVLENKKLINISWKNNDLWLLTRVMKSNDNVEVYHYIEKSSLGILQGEYIIKEVKD